MHLMSQGWVDGCFRSPFALRIHIGARNKSDRVARRMLPVLDNITHSLGASI